MPRGQRLKLFLRGLLKFLVLVLVAGGIGVALGMGLSTLAADDEPAAPGAQTTEATAGTAVPATAPPAAVATTATTATATTSSPPSSPLARVAVSVLDARLFTDSTPSGRREQRARVTVRLRADNAGAQRVTLAPATLRVGSVRIPADPAGARFDPLGAGAAQTVTLRFALAGEATPKVVRDRRARILVAGRSLPMRVKIEAPAG